MTFKRRCDICFRTVIRFSTAGTLGLGGRYSLAFALVRYGGVLDSTGAEASAASRDGKEHQPGVQWKASEQLLGELVKLIGARGGCWRHSRDLSVPGEPCA